MIKKEKKKEEINYRKSVRHDEKLNRDNIDSKL